MYSHVCIIVLVLYVGTIYEFYFRIESFHFFSLFIEVYSIHITYTYLKLKSDIFFN